MTANPDNLPSLAVIGGGPSGVTAALSASAAAKAQGRDIRITIFESSDRILKKLLVTGNGRCNLSNQDLCAEHYFGATDLFDEIYPEFDLQKTLFFFEKLGLLTVTDASGRIYPQSLRAASVADALLYALQQAGIRIETNQKIDSVKREKKGYLLNGLFYADALIFAAGGSADAAGKHTGSVYGLLKDCGVRITPLQPSLTAFTVKDFTKSLKGIRSNGKLTLFADNKRIAQTHGEIQYTEYGLSGIPAMQLSAYAARSARNAQLLIVADSLPEMDDDAFFAHLGKMQKQNPDMPFCCFMTGLMPKALALYLLKESDISGDLPLSSADAAAANRLLMMCKRKLFFVKGLRGYENAQVTSGGVAGDEITDRLMLKKMPHAYVCGEVIDIDGDCGGYNLQWAWSSGAVAGKNAVLEII